MLETDYLIIGSGALGMAFADIILTETNANIIIVDKFHKPGGHWNIAYPFVRLHQPSMFYGVSSLELSNGLKDKVGLNKGLNSVASGAEISAYYDNVMQHQFLPTGRVQYFPLCEYKGEGKFSSLITDTSYEVKVHKKTVDARYIQPKVPANHTPSFSIAPEVQFLPINELPTVSNIPTGFVIIGAGKTGIDACLWLLENQVDASKITWIMPRDSWLLDRRHIQPCEEFFELSMGSQAATYEAAAQATSISDLFDRLEAAGVFLRIDKNVTPTMFRMATVSKMELEQLRKITNIVRMGRVQHIEKDQIVLDEGSIPTNLKQIHIDCSSSAISRSPIKPVFDGDLITLQTVKSGQPLFSAAFIAHVEAAYSEERKKNKLCTVVPISNYDIDWIKMTVTFMKNHYVWIQDKELYKWICSNRLERFSQLIENVSEEDEEKQIILKRIQDSFLPAMIKLNQFIGELSCVK